MSLRNLLREGTSLSHARLAALARPLFGPIRASTVSDEP